jgi:hypothetical protein
MSPNQFVRLRLLPLALSLLCGCGPTKEMPSSSSSEPSSPNSPSVQLPSSEPPRKAETGVGIAGRSLQQEQGIGKMIAQPAATLFTVREKVVFEIQLPQAVALFQASEGRLPNSHEEYFEKIIDANRINLPKLPAGQAYRYRPDLGELWVEPDPSSGSNP